METIQLTAENQDNLNELITIMGGIETQLKAINETLVLLNKNIVSIGNDTEQITYLKQFD